MENISTSTLTTVGGWAVIIGVGGLIYYRAQTKAGRRQPANKSTSSHSKVPTGEYEKNVASAASATKKKAEKALKPKPKPSATTTTATTAKPAETGFTTGTDYDPDAEAAANRRMNDEFARQYSNAKSGTKFEASKKDDKKAKSVKQSRAREIEIPDDKVSVPSSTTGDADDDLSEANSPEVVAADSRDVSDMLEPTATGPSVMRITDTDAVKTKQKKEKKAEVVETKKQRQNRKKAEAAKAARQEEELERKKLEEAQRRQARVAEGRAAKDGSTFMAANKESVWKPKPAEEEPAKLVQLLDTDEQKPAAEVAKAKASTPKPAASNNSTKERTAAWMSAVPSEEEQIKLLQDEDSWNEVTSKKAKKGKKAHEDTANSTENVASSATPVAAPAAKAPVNGSNKNTKPALSSSSSFAALTPDETTDDNEVEEEWEV